MYTFLHCQYAVAEGLMWFSTKRKTLIFDNMRCFICFFFLIFIARKEGSNIFEIALQHSTTLLTVGRQMGACWPGFSRVGIIHFIFLTSFDHKLKTLLEERVIKLRHVLSSSLFVNSHGPFLKYMK